MSIKKRILLVDDSKLILKFEQLALGDAEYSFSTAADGDEAVGAALADPPDLILMDLHMPRMNGIDACQALRQDARTRGIPILLVTTEDANDQARERMASCTDFVVKPFDRNNLVAKVKHHLGM